MNHGYKGMGSIEKLAKDREVSIHEKKCLYEAVIVPMALYEAETWAMRSSERKRVKVVEMHL